MAIGTGPIEGIGTGREAMKDPGSISLPKGLPRVFFHLPHNYRARAGYYRPIPYRELSRNWRTWERDKYWERHGWNRREYREREHGIAPPYTGRHDLTGGTTIGIGATAGTEKSSRKGSLFLRLRATLKLASPEPF